MNTREMLLVQKYAGTFVDQVADSSDIWVIYNEIENLIEVIRNTKLNRLLQDPTISDEDKANFVHTIRQSDYNVVNSFVELIIDDKQTGLLLEILNETLLKISRSQNEFDAELVSAYPLTDEQKEKLRKIAKQRFDVKVRQFNEKIDKSLLGGFILTVNHRVIDASVRTQLEEMRNKL